MSDLMGRKVTLHDNTLRDGMHPKRHLITLDQMRAVAQGHVVERDPEASQIHALHPSTAAVSARAIRSAKSSPVRSAAAVMMSRLPAYRGR